MPEVEIMGNCSAKDASVSYSATGASFEDGGGKTTVDYSPKQVRDIMKDRVGEGGGGSSGDEEVGFKKLEVLQSPEKGVWRVRVAIKSEQWAQILKEQANTEGDDREDEEVRGSNRRRSRRGPRAR